MFTVRLGLLSCLIFFSACSDNPSQPKPPVVNYEELSEILNAAYDQNSQTQLDAFFETWHEMIPPISAEEFINESDTVQEAYRVFLEFYSPTDLNRLTHGEHENFETNFRYIVNQNKLRIAVADTNPRFYYYHGVNLSEIKVNDFRPGIQHGEFKSVFLTAEADSIIYHYIFNPDSSYKSDYQQRASFLREAMQLSPHHWAADYHKYTMPYADYIVFNDSFDKALIQFRVFFQFGDAYLEKSGGNWTLVSSELTAIE